ncbi:MAG: hypothetical protein GY769_18600 [bacterium]|nr:hypothetical protein [bacterium]
MGAISLAVSRLKKAGVKLGYAHALNKPIIQLTSISVDDLPFDVQTWPTLSYKIGAVSELAPELAKRLKTVLK